MRRLLSSDKSDCWILNTAFTVDEFSFVESLTVSLLDCIHKIVCACAVYTLTWRPLTPSLCTTLDLLVIMSWMPWTSSAKRVARLKGHKRKPVEPIKDRKVFLGDLVSQ